MYIYILVFSISCFFFYISEKSKNKGFKKIAILMAILLPCLLAGLRSNKIGTDVMVYAKPLFNVAENSQSFSDFLSQHLYGHKMVNGFEIGYVFLTYFIAKIFNNFNVLLFIIELLMILPLYKGLTKFKELNGKIWLCMLVYYLMFFNLTLNAMRQFIGISFAFYALSIEINEKSSTKKCLLYLLISILFHKSSALALMILLIFITTKNNLKISFGIIKFDFKRICFMLMILLATIAIVKPQYLSLFLDFIGFDKYTNYINGNYRFSYFSFLKTLPILLLYILNKKNFEKKYNNAKFYSTVLALSVIIGQAVSLNIRAARISYIYSIFYIVIIPLLITTIKNNNKRKSVQLLVIGCLIYYWYYIYVYMGSSETIPYSFYF